MKGDYIYYYGSEDDFISGKPPLGSIFLPGNHVVEVPFSPGDAAEKYPFEIQAGQFLLLLTVEPRGILWHVLSISDWGLLILRCQLEPRT